MKSSSLDFFELGLLLFEPTELATFMTTSGDGVEVKIALAIEDTQAGGESDNVSLFLGLVLVGSINLDTFGLASFEIGRGATPRGGVACTSGLKVRGSARRPLAAMIISSGLGPNRWSSKLASPPEDDEGVLVMFEAVMLDSTTVPRPRWSLRVRGLMMGNVVSIVRSEAIVWRH